MSEQTLRWIIAGSFIAFFLVEIGDKTQIATVVLAAEYSDVLMVVLGTTLGMMAANLPVVLEGHFAADKLPLRLIHGIAAVLFIVLGILTLFSNGITLA